MKIYVVAMNTLSKKTVLVLEHDSDVNTTVRLMLESLGHVVTVVSSPADALAVLSRQRVDVVLTNRVGRTFTMGDCFPSLVQAVQPECAVLLTARDRESARGAVARRGVLLKPFSISKLDASIASFFAG